MRDAIVHLIALEHPELLEKMVRDLWQECRLLTDKQEEAEKALAELTVAITEPGEA